MRHTILPKGSICGGGWWRPGDPIPEGEPTEQRWEGFDRWNSRTVPVAYMKRVYERRRRAEKTQRRRRGRRGIGLNRTWILETGPWATEGMSADWVGRDFSIAEVPAEYVNCRFTTVPVSGRAVAVDQYGRARGGGKTERLRQIMVEAAQRNIGKQVAELLERYNGQG